MTSRKAIGKALRDLRKRARKTLQDSASICGHDKQWLSNIESGIRRLTFDDAKLLTEYYGSNLSELSNLADSYEMSDIK